MAGRGNVRKMFQENACACAAARASFFSFLQLWSGAASAQAAKPRVMISLSCHPRLDRGSRVAGLRSHTQSTLKHYHVDITNDLPRRLAQH